MREEFQSHLAQVVSYLDAARFLVSPERVRKADQVFERALTTRSLTVPIPANEGMESSGDARGAISKHSRLQDGLWLLWHHTQEARQIADTWTRT